MALMSALALHAPAVRQFLATAASKATVWELLDFVQESVGDENSKKLVIALWVVGGLVGLWIVRSMIVILWTPSGSSSGATSLTSKKSAGARKQQQQGSKAGGAHGTEDGSKVEPVPDSAAKKVVVPPLALPLRQTADDAAVMLNKRSRPLHAVDPSSSIRGFPRIGALAVSPCQQFLIISCRKTHKCYLYPQNKKKQFMEKGKELQLQHFTNLAPIFMGAEAAGKADVPTVVFSADGGYVAIAESTTDTVYMLKLQPLSLVWAYKLPKARLASQLHNGRWGLCSTVNANNVPDALMVLHDKDAEVEVLHHLGKQQSLIHRFKIGNASSWAMSGKDIAVGGTFMKEARVSSINMRDVASMTLDKRFVWAPRAAKLRAFAFVAPKAPDFNTRHLLVCFYDDGFGEVLDVSCEDAPEVRSVGTFTDADFASDSKSSCNMIAAVGGQAYHEVVSIALWAPCGDVAVWKGPVGSDGLIKLNHVVDLHDTHDGDHVTAVQFIQHGLGIATAGDNDDRHVRLWTLPTTA